MQSIGMWRATYVPGTWVVLSGPTSLLVMMPAPAHMSSLLNDLWSDVVAARTLTEFADKLASFRVDLMPSLAAFFWAGGEMRSLIRGSLQAVDLATGNVIAEGEGFQTWHEIGLGEVRQVRVDMDPVDQESLLQLPLVVGAVLASAVVIDATDEARLALPTVADAEVWPQRAYGEEALAAAAVPAGAQAMTAEQPDDEDPEDDTDTEAEADLAGVAEDDADDQPDPSADEAEPADEDKSGEGEPEPPAPEPEPPAPEPGPPAEEASAPEGWGVADAAAPEPVVLDMDDGQAPRTTPSPATTAAFEVDDPAPASAGPVGLNLEDAAHSSASPRPAGPGFGGPPAPGGFQQTAPGSPFGMGQQPPQPGQFGPNGQPMPGQPMPGAAGGFPQGQGPQQPDPFPNQGPFPAQAGPNGQPMPGQAPNASMPGQPGGFPGHLNPPGPRPGPNGQFGPNGQPMPAQQGFPQQPNAQPGGYPGQPNPGPPPGSFPGQLYGQQFPGQLPGPQPPSSYASPDPRPYASPPPAPAPQGQPAFSGAASANQPFGPAPQTSAPASPDTASDGTVFSTGLAATHKPNLTAAPAGPGLVLAAMCNLGHANPPRQTTCLRCLAPVDTANPRLVTRPVLATLQTAGGATADLTDTVLIGRSPQPQPGDQNPILLPVPSPNSDISRTHVRVAAKEWAITVTDLHSTNGTMLVRPDQQPVRMVPGSPVEVEVGTVIDLGDGATITVQAPS